MSYLCILIEAYPRAFGAQSKAPTSFTTVMRLTVNVTLDKAKLGLYTENTVCVLCVQSFQLDAPFVMKRLH